MIKKEPVSYLPATGLAPLIVFHVEVEPGPAIAEYTGF